MAETLPIPFAGRPTYRTYRKAQWLHLRRSFGWMVLLWAIAGVGIVAQVILSLADGKFEPLPVLIALAVVVGLSALMEVGLRRSWQSHRALREPVDGGLFDDHFKVRSEVGSSKLLWDYFLKWTATNRLLLLYQADNCLHILGRDLFASDEDWRRATALAAEKVPKTSRTKRRRRLTNFLV